nr:hypothetical protein [Tanacetum cinerariifolium]
PVVFREPDQGKYKPLPEVEGKGKEKGRKRSEKYKLLKFSSTFNLPRRRAQ